MPSPYGFNGKVEQDLFDATAKAWRSEVASNPTNLSGSYYEGRLQQCGQALRGQGFSDGGGALCAVVAEGSDQAAAFIVLTYANGQHLKMLDVTVQPSLDAADREPNIFALAWIAATAIVGCIGLTYHAYPCNELKIRTSWPLDQEFLTAVMTALMGNEKLAPIYEVNTHGNWMVVKKRQV